MAKKTKPKTPPVPKRKERTYTMPTEYLSMVADRILTTNPTKEIILNTIKSIWQDGRDNGYFSRLSEASKFRDKREATIKEMFDALKDRIDDNIHPRGNNQNNK